MLSRIARHVAGVAAAVPSAEPGLTIIVRETFPASVIQTTAYIQPDRTRVESQVAPARSDAGGELLAHHVQRHRSASITRCDLQKIPRYSKSQPAFVPRKDAWPRSPRNGPGPGGR